MSAGSRLRTRRQTEEALYAHLFKIVLVGDSSVGKSNLLARYTGHDFDPTRKSTIGVEFASTVVAIDNVSVKAQIWDTAGQERYRAIANSYYRGAVGVLLVFDVSARRTFLNLSRWMTELRKYAEDDVVIAIAGNKADLGTERREVDPDEVRQFAQENDVIAVDDVSAKDGTHVADAFETLIKAVFDRATAKGTLGNRAHPSAVLSVGSSSSSAPPLGQSSPCC
ncbi:Ras family [Plasmodiophora brassicae]